MNTEDFKRKLTAILSADVEGYSRLMGEDEDATIRTLTSYRELMSTLIQKHRGRVVDSTGDNLLAEFSSVVDAVRCAVEIQEELRVRNAELPEGRKMHFRIGINLGDVVEEGERIYGDGINIAARVEGLAEGGGICISGTVYDSIKNKLSLSYESLGEHTVKNIKEPVRVFRMRVGPEAAAPVVKEKKVRPKKWQWAALAVVVILIIGAVVIWNFYFRAPPIEPASIEKMAFPLPDKPSIAVLPLVNFGADQDQDFLADGITENIITALSKTAKMFVIDSNSIFTYKGKSVKVQQVAENLGVRYVLKGSVQRSGDRLRVTVQLIDALTGHHLWAEQYDRDLEELFDMLDGITHEIVIALEVKLTSGEQARVWATGTDNIKAWEYFGKAIGFLSTNSKEYNVKAQRLLEQALKIDPNYASAWSALSMTYFLEYIWRWSDYADISLQRSFDHAEKAISLDDSNAFAHAVLGLAYLLKGQTDEAIAEGEKSIALGSNQAITYFLMSLTKQSMWKSEEAITLIKKAMRLQPYYPASYLGFLGSSYHQAGRYEEALTAYKKTLERCQECGEDYIRRINFGLILTYLELGQVDRARPLAEKLSMMKKSNIIALWSYNPALYKDYEHVIQLLSPIADLFEEALEKNIYVHKGTPAFKFEYPAGSEKLAPMTKSQVLRMRTPDGLGFEASVADIPEGVTVADYGPKLYAPALERFGSNVKVISNREIILKDGTKAYRTDIKWLYKENIWLTTLVVSTYKDDKMVFLATHPPNPNALAWIVESLTFE
jgi:TolB-like protein/class 3 adenylate cyclase